MANPHVALTLLKHKQFLISRKFSDGEVANESFMDELVNTYTAALFFFNYFDVVFKEVHEAEPA